MCCVSEVKKMNKNTGEIIKDLRKRLGLTQEEFEAKKKQILGI